MCTQVRRLRSAAVRTSEAADGDRVCGDDTIAGCRPFRLLRAEFHLQRRRRTADHVAGGYSRRERG